MFFKRFLIGFFAIFAILMLYIFIIRLATGKTGFMGFKDLLNYFEGVDFSKPLNDFISHLQSINKSFDSIISAVSKPTTFWINFILPVTALMEIGKVVSIICVAVYDFVALIVNYFMIFVNFINYITAFEGYPSISYTYFNLFND